LLKTLAPKLSYTLDESNARLRIVVDPTWFVPQVIDNAGSTQASSEANTEPYSAFLNYQVQSFFNDQQGFSGLSVPYHLGINIDQFILDSSFDFTHQDDYFKNNRLLTALRWDDPEAMQVFNLGDATPRGQRLFNGSGILAGLSLRKSFQLNRYAQISPELELRTAVTTPTHAKIFVNGSLIKETDLLPGEVILNQLPVGASQGQAKLVLTDNLGHEKTITEPFYLMYNQLKKDVHDYEYSVGFAREHLGERDFSYQNDITLQGFHRYGLTNATTLGLAGIKQSRFTLLNPQIQTTIGQYQQLDLDAGLSQFGRRLGAAFEAHYRFLLGGFQFHGSGHWTGKQYTGIDRNGSALQHWLNAAVRYGSSELGMLNLSYNQSKGWDSQTSANQTLQLSYGKRLFEGVYLTASAQQSLSQNTTGVLLSLEYRPTLTKDNPSPLFNNLRYATRYLSEDNQDALQNELNVSGSNYFYNYDAQLAQQEKKLLANIRGQYKTDNHLYTAAVTRSEDNTQTGQITVAGGIAALKEGIYFGRPISDSFAVVRMENSDKPTLVRANNMTLMETDSDTVLLPEFSSYSSYQIGIQSKRFNNLKDIRYNLENAMQPLVITKRGGAFLDLKISRLFAVEGNIYINKDKGKKEYLALLPLQVSIDGKMQEHFTGEQGYFYLENLNLGRQVLTIIRKEGNCQAAINVQETHKNLLKLGEIECVN
jgi:outer membrane usher protein